MQFRKLEYLQKTLFNFICPPNVLNCHNPKGIKLLTRLRLGLRHIRKHKFSRFTFCSCGKDIGELFFLHCPNYSHERSVFFNVIGRIDKIILARNDFQANKILLYGDSNSNNINKLLVSINFVNDQSS